MRSVLFVLVFMSTLGYAQVGVGTTTPDASAALDVSSTTAGVLVPRMTEAQRTSIATPATGLLVYQTNNTAGFWFYDGSAWSSLSVPAVNPSWELQGNVGTSPGTDFMGTADDQDVVFKRNNVLSGRLNANNLSFGVSSMRDLNPAGSSAENTAFGTATLQSLTFASHNSAFGYHALHSNTNGADNSAFGHYALYSNLGGEENSVFGYRAMESSEAGQENAVFGAYALSSNNWSGGNGNCVFGYDAMRDATNSRYNCAFGHDSLKSNTGEYNCAFGRRALYSNTSGSYNVAIGQLSMRNADLGSNNTAVGNGSLQNNSVDGNTAIGSNAMGSNTTGLRNTSVGTQSLDENLTSSDNTAVGYNTLSTNYDGHCTAMGSLALAGVGSVEYATALGSNAFTTKANSIEYFDNSTAIGYNAQPGASNTIRLGNSAVTTIGGYANWSNVSDGRFKTNISENVAGLDFILKLKPVTYQLDLQALARFLNTPDELRIKDAENKKSKEVQIGFIAQDVEKAAKEIGFDFHGVDVPKSETSHYSLRYAEFVPPLVKAIQEQQTMIHQLRMEIQELKAEMNTLSSHSN
ncbi:tail fiber domain-containing protein [Altibacter lentus]|uniref:tail fiber domain-containing protein n=1 Tax=Altibacter lentus TaxID=1223410 RepID=UPI0012689522|nr:tail fiber domain-containing protein [Altibacter lentus]